MSDLRELYQAVIIDHNKRPRNFHHLEKCNHHAEGFNPLCGDKVDIYVAVKNDKIEEISFTGSGCAISMASASLLTETLQGKSTVDAENIFQNFHKMITTHDDVMLTDDFEKLTVLAGVREYPSRVKCATLAWHTLHAALHNEQKSICTE